MRAANDTIVTRRSTYQIVLPPELDIMSGQDTHSACWFPVLAGRVLFAAGHQGVVARDPGTGRELWNSGAPSAGGNIGPIHWQSPIVIRGPVFCPDESGHVTAYGLE